MPVPSVVGISGPGYLFKISDATGANFTTVALSKDITGPSVVVGETDVTTQDVADYTRVVDPELIDSGSFATTIIYRPDTSVVQASVLAACQNRSMLNVQLYNNPPTNSKYWSGGGFFKKFDQKTPVQGGVMTVDIEFRISGKITQN
jgi:hypothetical protein